MKTVSVNVQIQLDIQEGGDDLTQVQNALDFINSTLQRTIDDNYNAQIFVSDISNTDIIENGESNEYKIRSIGKIIEEWGEPNFVEENWGAIWLSGTKDNHWLIERIGVDYVEITNYINDIDTAITSIELEDLEYDILDEVYNLMLEYEISMNKSFDRSQD